MKISLTPFNNQHTNVQMIFLHTFYQTLFKKLEVFILLMLN